MQKTNFKTRLLALLTAVFMVIVSMPFAAFAANEGGTDVIPNELSVSFNCWDDGVKVVSKGADNSGDHYATYVLNSKSEQKSLPTLENVPENKEFDGWYINETNVQVVDTRFNFNFLKDYAQNDSVTINARFKDKVVEPETKTVKFCFQLNTAEGNFTDKNIAGFTSTDVSYVVGGKDTVVNVPAVEPNKGYTFKGWTDDNGDFVMNGATYDMFGKNFDAYEDGQTIWMTAVFEKVEEPSQPEKPEEKKTVSVTITTNNEQGIFPDYDGQEVIHFDNLDPNTDQQFELPKVEAKPGYEFIGWHVNGNEVGAWDADAKTFGITGLAHFEEGSNVGCLTIAAVYKAETERTVEVTFSVDPDKGEFEKNDLYTSPAANVMKLTATEFDGTQYAIPTVKAKAGYKFVGWKGQGADAIAWNAEAKTFGVTGLCFFNGDDATTGYATVEAVFEKIEDKKNDNSSSSSSASSSSNKTTTASNEKQVVKAAAAPANTTKVLPKTGASNVAPLLGGSLAVVALLMGYGVYSLVLRKKD